MTTPIDQIADAPFWALIALTQIVGWGGLVLAVNLIRRALRP